MEAVATGEHGTEQENVDVEDDVDVVERELRIFAGSSLGTKSSAMGRLQTLRPKVKCPGSWPSRRKISGKTRRRALMNQLQTCCVTNRRQGAGREQKRKIRIQYSHEFDSSYQGSLSIHC